MQFHVKLLKEIIKNSEIIESIEKLIFLRNIIKFHKPVTISNQKIKL